MESTSGAEVYGAADTEEAREMAARRREFVVNTRIVEDEEQRGFKVEGLKRLRKVNLGRADGNNDWGESH